VPGARYKRGAFWKILGNFAFRHSKIALFYFSQFGTIETNKRCGNFLLKSAVSELFGMTKESSKNLVKDYENWAIYVSENQSYLGRCVVWCKRENALDLADATPEEWQELFLVLRNLREAAKKVFQPDWFNYSFLGNETRHLHGHFVPRYAKPKMFMDIMFEDRLYGHNYKTDQEFKTSVELLAEVRDKLRSVL